MQGPLVMKIGGSLIDDLPDIMAALRHAQCQVLIIPGGGPFANLVRGLHAPDTESHWMAILGMEQYGWYMSSFGIPASPDLRLHGGPTVFLPYAVLRDQDPFPHSWNVTSDSIAAWAACRLGARLVLLKAVEGLMKDGELLEVVTSPVPCEEVDPHFLKFTLDHRIPAFVMNGKKIGRLRSLLKGRKVKGTSIGTTF